MVILWFVLYIAVGSLVLFGGLIICDQLFNADSDDGIFWFSVLTAALWPVLVLPYAATVAAALYLRSKEDNDK